MCAAVASQPTITETFAFAQAHLTRDAEPIQKACTTLDTLKGELDRRIAEIGARTVTEEDKSYLEEKKNLYFTTSQQYARSENLVKVLSGALETLNVAPLSTEDEQTLALCGAPTNLHSAMMKIAGKHHAAVAKALAEETGKFEGLRNRVEACAVSMETLFDAVNESGGVFSSVASIFSKAVGSETAQTARERAAKAFELGAPEYESSEEAVPLGESPAPTETFATLLTPFQKVTKNELELPIKLNLCVAKLEIKEAFVESDLVGPERWSVEALSGELRSNLSEMDKRLETARAVISRIAERTFSDEAMAKFAILSPELERNVETAMSQRGDLLVQAEDTAKKLAVLSRMGHEWSDAMAENLSASGEA